VQVANLRSWWLGDASAVVYFQPGGGQHGVAGGSKAFVILRKKGVSHEEVFDEQGLVVSQGAMSSMPPVHQRPPALRIGCCLAA
jgi:hypothetical protein